MTELTFLLDLLLNHKLPKATQQAVKERVKAVEEGLATYAAVKEAAFRNLPPPYIGPSAVSGAVPPHLVGQSPSTIAAMMRHEQNGAPPPVITPKPVEVPPPVVAVTPAAQAALAQRNEAINQAISGKPEKGRTSPRKF